MTIKQIIESIFYDVKNPDNIRLYHGTTSVGKDNILYHGGFAEDLKLFGIVLSMTKLIFMSFIVLLKVKVEKMIL